MVKASVVWLNYNSMKFKDIMLQSLDSFMNLDFDDYELIIVDNASTDGTFELIRRYVEEKKPSNLKVKVIRNETNLGYAGGMNKGWEARDEESKYVAFANNDLIAEPDSLLKLIEPMEGDEKLSAVSGLVHYGDGRTIYSAGGWVSESWVGGGVCNGLTLDECTGWNKDHYVTYADGAYMLANVNIIKKSTPYGKPFIDETFLFLDDALLGLILWNKGYEVKYIPITAGYHYQSMTIKGKTGFYYGYRSSMALSRILMTRYSSLRSIFVARRYFYGIYLKIIHGEQGNIYLVAIRDGEELGNFLSDVIGKLSIYKAPYVKSSLFELTGLIHKKITFNELVLPKSLE